MPDPGGKAAYPPSKCHIETYFPTEFFPGNQAHFKERTVDKFEQEEKKD